MSSQLHIDKHYTYLFHKLCNHLSLSAFKSKVCINNDYNLNATLFLQHQLVALTKYDINNLSNSDILALLAHEVGHLYDYQKHYNALNWGNIKVGCVTLFFLIISLLLGGTHPILIDVFAFCTLCLTILILNASTTDNEYHADIIGAKLIGYYKMKHLMITANNYEMNQYHQLYYYARQLWSCPLAEMRILYLMLRFRIHLSLCIMHGSTHPSYRSRIRHLNWNYQKCIKK